MHRALATGLVALLALAGCSVGGTTPTGTPGSSSRPSATDSQGETSNPTGTAGLPTQSETAWGPIWDAVPAGFPVPDGAKPADPETGPVSAAYTVAAGRLAPRAIAEFYRDALDALSYGTGLDGPLEDGSFTVWSSSGYGCDTLETILPRGGESLVTVLYGTGCRFE